MFIKEAQKHLNQRFGEEVYWQIRNGLIGAGKLERGRGKGGSVRLLTPRTVKPKKDKGSTKVSERA